MKAPRFRTAIDWLPTGIVLAAALAMLAYGPIAQPVDYHAFADSRAWLGIPNAADVLSNAGFVLVGAWGLWEMRVLRRRVSFGSAWLAYYIFFVSLVMTGLGSAWYHWAPDNARLVWDRLPIALACAGLLAGVRSETRGPSWLPLPLLIVAAAASVMWWTVTQFAQGEGDLRPYLLVQGAPLVLIPLWQWMYRSPAPQRIAFGIAVALYVLAKIFEVQDRTLFEATGMLGGHAIKHLLATAAAAVIAANVLGRIPRLPGRAP